MGQCRAGTAQIRSPTLYTPHIMRGQHWDPPGVTGKGLSLRRQTWDVVKSSIYQAWATARTISLGVRIDNILYNVGHQRA